MIKFSAINESILIEQRQNYHLDKDPKNPTDKIYFSEVVSKEKEEFRVRKLYQEALELQMQSQYNELILLMEEILMSSIMQENHEITSHMKVVKAATYKLLANTHRKLNHYDECYAYYQMAIKMSSQDLNLLYGLAITCEHLKDWDNAVLAYERVLLINGIHWPSLDGLIIISFALVDFERCAQFCQRALYLDHNYDAAIYILQQMFTYQPSLKSLHSQLLIDVPNILTDVVDDQVVTKLTTKVAAIRAYIAEKRSLFESSDKIATVRFIRTISCLSWDEVARAVVERFISLKEKNSLDSIVDVRSLLWDQQMSPVSCVLPLDAMERDGLWLCNNIAETGVSKSCDLSEVVINDIGPKNNPVNLRITRNSTQAVEVPGGVEDVKKEQYYARLIRMNILNEVHFMADEKFKEYNDMVSQKKEKTQSNPAPDNSKYRAVPLGEDCKDIILHFVYSFDDRKVSIIEVAWDLVRYLITKEYFIWSSELIDDYLTLSSLIRTHVSSQAEESPMETLLSIKRVLLEVECLIDRKQSELEGKLHKSDKELKLFDFVPYKTVNEFSERIMHLEIKHGQEFVRELTVIQLRVLWLGFILADMVQNDEEVRLQVDSLKRCLLYNGIAVHMRPNCVHYSIITTKKIEDCLSASFKTLKIDVLCEMYKKEEYEEIIEKTGNIIGAVVLPKDDYAEDMNNYMIQISFNCSSYHKILTSLLRDPTKPIDRVYLIRIYTDTTSVLEEITNIVDILKDPKKKEHSSLTERQISFLIENYFKVSKILLTNATNFLKLLELHNMNLIDTIGVGEVSRFIVLAKEYFYHTFYNSVVEINVAHIWCLYTHFKSLELYDPVRYNQSVTYNPNDELDLPPSLNFLSLTHDYMSSFKECAQCDGAILKLIITAVVEYIEEIRPKFRKLGVFLANHSDVRSILDQALYCIRPVQRPDIDKSRKPIDHECKEAVSINFALVDALLSYIEPERIPDVDSVKNLSISVDLNNLFLEIISLLPDSIFQNAYSEEAIMKAIESDEPLSFRVLPRSKYAQLFYFVADHYFKNNEFEKALEYYIKNLRFMPSSFNSWAATALIYYKRLEDKFNMMDNNSESLSITEVMCCHNSFNHAISLDSENITILIEKGCFCYEVHSYASRILKKALTRDFDESFVKECEMWSRVMLENAKECYETALEADLHKDEKEEKWLYYYMLSKCMEKSEEYTLLDVLDSMEKSMEALESNGAKYVRRIVFYTKIPHRAVEAVEVYYKYHTTILKCLLKSQSTLLSTSNQASSRMTLQEKSKKIDRNLLLELQTRLINMNQSPFIVNVGKLKNVKNGGKKRMLPKNNDGQEPAKVARLSPNNDPNGDVIEMANVPPELRYEDNEDDCIIHEVVLPSQEEDTKSIYERCIELCRSSMEVVLQRLPLHYKALYNLAYIHSYVPHLRNLEKAYDYLMGSTKTDKSTINGLFKDRKFSNYFSGIWRIPVSDIDRNGSFAQHMYMSMTLLLNVLRQMNAWKDLSLITIILRKSGSDKRGFLSNGDRLMLIRKSMGHALYSVKEWLTQHDGMVTKDDLAQIHSLHSVSVKQSQGSEKMRWVLLEAFYRCDVAMEMYGHMLTHVDNADEKKSIEAPRIDNLNMNIIDKVVGNIREFKK